METMIQCHYCQEDMNEADWTANHHCCLHCGHSVDSPLREFHQPRPFRPLQTRLAFRDLAQPVHSSNLVGETRLYA